MNQEKNLLRGFYKTLVIIAVPIILQQLLQTSVNLLDTAMIGQKGDVPLAAVGLGNQVFFILNMMLFGVTSGGSIFVSQFWGKQDFAGIRKTLGITLILSIFFGAVFMLLAIFVPQILLGVFSDDQAVIIEGSRYLRIAALSYPLMAVSFALQIAFRSTEHVILPTVSTAVAFALNVVLNYIFIFALDQGVEGAAKATVISRALELSIVVAVSRILKFEVWGTFREYMAFGGEFVWRLIQIGLPVFISETMWGLGISSQNAIFAHVGTLEYDSFNITNTINQVTWVFFIGVGSAAGIIIGKKIGAGEIDGAKAYARRFEWFTPLCGFLIGLLLIPLSKTLPFFFNVSSQVITTAQQLLLILVCVYPLRAYNILTIIGIFRPGGDTFYGSLIDNAPMWVFSLPFACCAAFIWNWEPWMILLCLETEQFIKAAAGWLRVRSDKWIRNVTE